MPQDGTDPPLDTLKTVVDDIWIVDSGPVTALGMPLPVRMTVLRLTDGGLLLHSPTRFTPGLTMAIERLGPIRHLVAPNLAHWMFVRDWQRALPDAVTWGAPGVRQRGPVQKAGLQIDRELGPDAPQAWADEIAQVAVPGAAGFVEIALFHKASRTLVLTDIVQNMEARKLPLRARIFFSALGALGPKARPPLYLRALLRFAGHPAAEAAARLVALAPERVIFAHGAWFERDGTARLKRSLGWLLPESSGG